MRQAQIYYPECPEAFVVSLARTGDRSAFEELVRRRQSSIRNLMKRCSGEKSLADDLAQQVFLQVWLKIHTLKEAGAFGAWLKRVAISTWLLHQRKSDTLQSATELTDDEVSQHESTGESMDLNRALLTLPATVRVCVVLSYEEGMSHAEISGAMKLPLGTVKSHILRGTQRLQKILSVYREETEVQQS